MYYNFSDHSTDMDPIAIAHMNHFLSRYDCVSSYHLTSEDKKQVLKTAKDGCRFCQKQAPEVSFKKDAHAIPNSTGNRWLFSEYECDSCNDHFGRLLENHFGNFMHLNHTIFNVRGKNGPVKFIQSRNGLSIINDGQMVKWDGVPDEDIDFDQMARILSVKQKIPGFIPVAVYKTLVKTALTIMPEEELVHFADTREWLNEVDHQQTRFPFSQLWLLAGTFHDNFRWDQLSVVVSKRKESTSPDLPYMLFRLSYTNFDFQLHIPLCDQDINKEFGIQSITYLPHLYDMQAGIGKMQFLGQNMFDRENKKDQRMTFKIKDLDGSGTVTYIGEDTSSKENDGAL